MKNQSKNQNQSVWSKYVMPAAATLVIGGAIVYHAVKSNQYEAVPIPTPSNEIKGLVNSNYNNFNNDKSSNITITGNFVVGDVYDSKILEKMPQSKDVRIKTDSLELVVADSLKVK